MDLIVVESPTKARTLSRFLHGNYAVEATFGHVRDLPEKKIGVAVKATDGMYMFTPDYVVTKKQQDRINEIGKKVADAENIYLATDPDREGEAIAWHVGQLIDSGKSNMKRIVFHEITQKAIEEAMSHPREIDMKMVDAQQARRILDRLVGYKLSPILWRKIRKGLSAGRVQSVAVRLVVEKEKEIEAFVPVEYWDINVQVRATGGGEFTVELTEKNGQKIKINNGETAGQVKNDLENAIYQVAGVEKKEAKRSPTAPFTTSTLQQAGTSKFGWSAKKTMQVAQSLYEKGFITYHRTDSTNIADEALKMAADFIREKWGDTFYSGKPRIYVTKSKSAQEAHEAIRPTDIRFQASGAGDQFNRDELKLYDLIWKRFIGGQMVDARLERVTVTVSGNRNGENYGLTARGQTVKFEGWLTLFKDHKQAEQNGDSEEEKNLPELENGESLEMVKVLSEQKFTQPPARYNDASLIKTLEEMGIGRPSTYAPILSTIQDRQYVERVEKRFKPTPLGEAVNAFLVEHFPSVVDYQFTANMEDELDEVAKGEKEWQPVLSNFFKPFEQTLVKAAEGAGRVKVEVETTGEKCPLCHEGEVVVRIGKFGRFLACNRYPDCKYRANYVNKIGMVCPKCTAEGRDPPGDIILKKTRSGKTFFGCSNYPKCDFASWTKPAVPGENAKMES